MHHVNFPNDLNELCSISERGSISMLTNKAGKRDMKVINEVDIYGKS